MRSTDFQCLKRHDFWLHLIILFVYFSVPYSDSVLDMVFLMSSGSGTSSSDWTLLLQFLTNFVSNFNIGSNAVRVGLVRYGSTAMIDFSLMQYNTIASLQSKILTESQDGGTNNLAAGIQSALTVFANSVRNSAAKVIIIFTSNVSDSTASTLAQARSAKAMNIKIIPVAINLVASSSGYAELTQVATNPTEVDLLQISSYSNLFQPIIHLTNPGQHQDLCF